MKTHCAWPTSATTSSRKTSECSNVLNAVHIECESCSRRRQFLLTGDDSVHILLKIREGGMVVLPIF